MAPAVASGQYHKTILTYIYSHFFKARLYSNIHTQYLLYCYENI